MCMCIQRNGNDDNITLTDFFSVGFSVIDRHSLMAILKSLLKESENPLTSVRLEPFLQSIHSHMQAFRN